MNRTSAVENEARSGRFSISINDIVIDHTENPGDVVSSNRDRRTFKQDGHQYCICSLDFH